MTTTPYTTKTKINDAYTNTNTDSENDAAIALASSHIDRYVGYQLASSTADTPADITLDGSGTDTLMLAQDVQSFTSVVQVALDDSETAVQYVASYPLNSSHTSYLMLKLGRFLSGVANYKLKNVRLGRFSVNWTSPFTGHTLPDDVTSVCTQVAIEILKNGGQVSADGSESNERAGRITSETIGSYSVSYQNSQSSKETLSKIPNATEVLNKYRSSIFL